MRNIVLLQRARAIASNREAGASELLAEWLPLLGEAIACGQETALAVVREVCGGQPAMAALWNAGAAALAEFASPGRFARVRAEMERAPQALRRVAVAAVQAALAGEPRPTVLTLSYSSTVASILGAIARQQPLEVVCSESLPGGEGRRLHDALAAAGASVRLVADARLTTFLPAAAVVVGADAIAAHDWTNKAGTLGLATAASITGTPVYVACSRDKAQAPALRARAVLPPAFERTPASLATRFLTDGGLLTPAELPALVQRYAPDVERLLALL